MPSLHKFRLHDLSKVLPPACVHAQRRITVNGGMTMTGWFDIASLEDINQEEDTEGFAESKRWVCMRGVV